MKSKSLIYLFLIISLLTLTCSCALVSREQMLKDSQSYALPQQSKDNVGLVYVVRPNLSGTMVRFNLFVNDADVPEMEAGYTRGGQYIYFYIAPGTYTLYSVAENTAKGTITVEPNKIYYIEQIPSMGILFARNQLKLLDGIEGKYRLKNCEQGVGEIKRTLFP